MNLALRMAVAACALLVAGNVLALGPHEIVLIVNRDSENSTLIANHYAKLRRIPAQNIIHVSPPPGTMEGAADVTLEEFKRDIFDPVTAEIARRRIGDHILAWVYSSDFPIRIRGEQHTSIQGVTFTRCELPLPDTIREGSYASKLFTGPDREGGPFAESRSLEQYATVLQDAMPIPSMMLGYTGARGNTVDEILACLKLGAISDSSSPRAEVWLLKNDNVRSKARSWQFDTASEEINKLGVKCFVSAEPPSGVQDLLGVMAGSDSVAPASFGRFAAGGMGEHLTSFGAFFHEPAQSKLTEWIRAGATASAGTIIEPYAIWMKFPSARFYAHYAAGCTMLESFYQSIRCPLQTLLVGDPLAAPFRKNNPATLISVDDTDKPLSSNATFVASLLFGDPQNPPALLFLLDGRTIPHPGNKPDLVLDTTKLADGYHDLRLVAYGPGELRYQSFATLGFETLNRGRSVELTWKGTPPDKQDLRRFLPIRITATGSPLEFALISQERVIAKGISPTNEFFALDPRRIGPGPGSLQAVAIYNDKEAVRSKPLPVHIEDINSAPKIDDVTTLTDEGGRTVCAAKATDAEGDTVRVSWLQGVDLSRAKTRGGKLRVEAEGTCTLAAEGVRAMSLLDDLPAKGIEEFGVIITAPAYPEHAAGLVFDVKSEDDYAVFMLDGSTSCWLVGRVIDGVWTQIASRGLPIKPGKQIRISLQALEGRKMAIMAEDQPLAELSDVSLSGPLGLYSGKGEAVFRDVRFGPVSAPATVKDGDLAVDASSEATYYVRVSDGIRSAEQRVNPASAQ